jgi:hypothetical protein
MKSRLAILLMLVLGMTMSTAGAGLAISGTVNGNAAQTQYPPQEDGGDVLGEEDEGVAPEGDVAPEEDSSPPEEAAQTPRQVEAGVQSTGDDELPFTGFAAIPILLLGIVLTVSGAVLRRRVSRDG